MDAKFVKTMGDKVGPDVMRIILVDYLRPSLSYDEMILKKLDLIMEHLNIVEVYPVFKPLFGMLKKEDIVSDNIEKAFNSFALDKNGKLYFCTNHSWHPVAIYRQNIEIIQKFRIIFCEVNLFKSEEYATYLDELIGMYKLLEAEKNNADIVRIIYTTYYALCLKYNRKLE